METIFHVGTNDGSMLLSCKSTLSLDIIQPRTRLVYLPPRASLITSTQDHPKKTKQVQVPAQVHSSQKLPNQSQTKTETSTKPKAQDPLQAQTMKDPQPHQIITRKDQIMKQYSDVFDGIGKFLGPPYTIHLDPSIQPKQTDQCQYIWKKHLRKR